MALNQARAALLGEEVAVDRDYKGALQAQRNRKYGLGGAPILIDITNGNAFPPGSFDYRAAFWTTSKD